ncbi:hypothetical protein CWO92_13655 [Heyndrickxia camelliae]|uniref:Major facilitator superfamily (MFS) profile domain-containing protein n=1 Tax=Heyndrickxia camelliae TaxID=1707093 RepID=A0A2N3LII0_9BACI|nr:MFS transporter [Heyndrickxia camelliae]PKR84432.1 hypothetical protein CWO92_13655 [Heyndrickxia camelliae]
MYTYLSHFLFFFFIKLLYFDIAQGYILGSFAPTAYAYCFDVLEDKRRTLVIAVINMGFLMAGIIGQIISSNLASTFDWKAVFYFFSCVYLLLGLLALFILPSSLQVNGTFHKKKKWLSPELWKPSIIIGLGITFFTLMSFVAFYDSLSRYFAEDSKVLLYTKGIDRVNWNTTFLVMWKMVEKIQSEKNANYLSIYYGAKSSSNGFPFEYYDYHGIVDYFCSCHCSLYPNSHYVPRGISSK